jgi:hypothetical protein
MQGRNLDYGQQKSDSREGAMAKKTLLTMAKDLYELYVLLNDNDDLPQWCHYKLAGSQKDLSTVVDYLSSKIAKHCVDNNIDSHDLQLEITSAISSNIINEGFFDFFKKKKKSAKSIFNTLRRAKMSGILEFLEDVRKLASLVDIQGMFREKMPLSYEDISAYNSSPVLRKQMPKEADPFFSNLSIIIDKLENMSLVLNRLANTTTTSARIADNVNEISMFRRDAKTDQKSLALKIKLDLANKRYSGKYYKESSSEKRFADLTDLLPYEIKMIARDNKLNAKEKKEVILTYKDFVDSVIDRLKTSIEAEK